MSRGFWMGVIGLGLLVGCATAPITGRRQLSLVSPSQEMQLGLTAFEQLKKETPINRDPRLNEMVQRVGKRIAAASGNDLPNAQWEFVVFDSPDANAFCLPGGKVGIYTGILPITQDEAGLATVMGHEVAHATARHGAERMSQALAAETGGQLLGVGLSRFDPRVQALAPLVYGLGTQLGVLLPYSRKFEAEADRIGLTYMARAGYNPEEALNFWQRFAQHSAGRGRSTPKWLRTHPVDSERIQMLQKWIPEAKAQYNPNAGVGSSAGFSSGRSARGSDVIGRPR